MARRYQKDHDYVRGEEPAHRLPLHRQSDQERGVRRGYQQSAQHRRDSQYLPHGGKGGGLRNGSR